MTHIDTAKKVHDIKNALGVILLTVQVLSLEAEKKTVNKELKSSAKKIENQVNVICVLLGTFQSTRNK